MRRALHAEWTKLRTTAGPAWLLLASVIVAVPRIGIYLGPVPVAILGVLAISSEYSTGLISITLAAIPRRAAVLAAKATILTASAGLAALVAQSLRPVLYLVLTALLSLGTGAVIRDSAAAIGTVLGLLYLPPILAFSIADPHWQRLILKAAPMSGLPVLAAWAAGALLAGALLLQLRDT